MMNVYKALLFVFNDTATTEIYTLSLHDALPIFNFYWYEHPMPEYRVSAYEKLCRELDIPILAPEIAAGSLYTRADWIRRQASDRKSTRLNSSHANISYAVFCLKKQKRIYAMLFV